MHEFPRRRVDLLFPPGAEEPSDGADDETLRDLNLDRVIAAVLSGRGEYDLEPVLRAPLSSPDAVAHRHAVLRDLADPDALAAARAFAEGMQRARAGRHRASRTRHVLQRRMVFLDAADAYVATVQRLADGLAAAGPRSTALAELAAYAIAVVTSPGFGELEREAREVRAAVEAAGVRVHIKGNRITVGRPVDEETPWAADVAAVFAAVTDGGGTGRVRTPPVDDEANRLEATIAERAAELHPAAFGALEGFCTRHAAFVDPGLEAAERELQFYLGAVDWADRLAAAGLPVCLPKLSDAGAHAELRLVGVHDAALGLQRAWDERAVVLNDVELSDAERVLVVTGPNQGGKTTFARAIGQVCHLAAIGLPVPARLARLPLVDRVLTNFARGEELGDLRGALERDVVRTREALRRATPRSLVVLNEVFTSTTVQDAVLLAGRVLDRLLDLGCLGVCVTFLDELAATHPAVVSYVSQVDADDPTIRTFRVIREAGGGPTYAEVLARAHGLDREALRRRLS